MPPDEAKLDDLADRWLAEAEAGRLLAAADLCPDRPDLVPALEARLRVLRRFRRLAAAGDAPTAQLSAPGADTSVPDTGPAVTTGGPAAQLPRPGRAFGGFEVLSELGRGGMGAVYRARDPDLQREVALKVVLPAAAARPGTRDRFLREARALAAVHHDHVVPVFEVGEAGGAPFLVMPLLAGETLAARLGREGALPAAEVVRIGREAALGLAALHAKGLVHRDVKPANLWLEAPSGRVKLLDLGLARDPTGDDRVTADGAIIGTPVYMSPEQANGYDLDARSDLFSLGSVLYEAAVGRAAFAGDSMTAILAAVGEKDPPPAAKANPAIPATLSDLIARLHRKPPAERPASAAAIADELGRFVLGEAPGWVPEQDLGPPGGRPLRRRLSVPIAAAISCAALALVWLLPGPRWPADGPGPDVRGAPEAPGPGPSLGAPLEAPVSGSLRVSHLDVLHFEAAGAEVRRRGVLGADTFGAVFGDEIEVVARLSRPAYAYLIAFRPDGRDVVLYPQDDAEVPDRTDRPTYPSKRRGVRYELSDGTGLWLVALMASDRSLPAYREWRTAHPGGPWMATPGRWGVVWRDDGQWLEQFVPGQGAVRGTRGEKEAADKGPIVGVVDWLKAEAGTAAVSAVGFTVEAKR